MKIDEKYIEEINEQKFPTNIGGKSANKKQISQFVLQKCACSRYAILDTNFYCKLQKD